MPQNYSFKKYSYKGSGLILIAIGTGFPILIALDYGISIFTTWIGLLPMVFFLAMLLIGTIQLYYLEINQQQILVKNLILFWFCKAYPKNEIQEISYYARGGRKNFKEGIQIKLTHRRNKKCYLMTSYAEPFWSKMEEKLEAYNYPYTVKK